MSRLVRLQTFYVVLFLSAITSSAQTLREVNIKAELEIAHLHEKTDRIYENMMARFTKLEKQLAPR